MILINSYFVFYWLPNTPKQHSASSRVFKCSVCFVTQLIKALELVSETLREGSNPVQTKVVWTPIIT